MNEVILGFKASIKHVTDNLKEELKGIRTGRANPGMIENMVIETYGGTMKMKLMEIAGITNDGNAALMITAYDPSTVQDIEKAILTSPLGITPKTEGNTLLIRIPPLSEEQRIKYTKFASQLIEDAKNKIRFEREDARKKIKRMEDEKAITEDDKYRAEKEIDQIITSSNDDLQLIKNNKEKEIMEV